MTLALKVLLALFTLYYAGYGLSRLLLARGRWRSVHVLVTGYAFSQVTYFVAYLALNGRSTASVQVVFALASAVNLVSLVVCRPRLSWPGLGTLARRHAALVAGAVLVVLVAAPALLMGEWGGYWHSGNEDMFDGVWAGERYYRNEVLASGSGDEAFQGMFAARRTVGPARPASTAPKYAVLAHAVARGQYASGGYWHTVLGDPEGPNAFLVQAIVDLILMYLGVAVFARGVAGLGGRVALAVAVVAVANNFYVTSYLNGHQGSMMFMAVIPSVIVLGLEWIAGLHGKRVLLLLGIWLAFAVNAYPYPLPFFLMPLAIAFCVERVPLLRRAIGGTGGSVAVALLGSARGPLAAWGRWAAPLALAVAAAALVGASWYVWDWAAFLRERAATGYRSWGTMHNFVGYFQYWGIWQSTVAYNTGILRSLLDSGLLRAASWVIAASLTALAAYGALRVVGQRSLYAELFLLCNIVFAILIRTMVQDPYFFYKILYVTQFVVVTMVAAAVVHLARTAGRVRLGVLCLVGATLLANLANTAAANAEIINRDYNRLPAQYRGILELPADVLQTTHVDVARADYAGVVELLLRERGISPVLTERRSEYVLRKTGFRDVLAEPGGEVIWRNDLFSLEKAAKEDRIEFGTMWEPDQDLGLAGWNVIRWISGGSIGKWAIDVWHPSGRMGYVYCCTEIGPSLLGDHAAISVEGRGGRRIGAFDVSYRKCDLVDISTVAVDEWPLEFQSSGRGRIVSPIDPRELDVRVYRTGLAQGRYTWEMLDFLNPPRAGAGASAVDPSADQALLGHGWYPLERHEGEWFHWTAGSADVVLALKDPGAGDLSLDIEAPQRGEGQPTVVSLAYPDGSPVGQAEVRGRAQLRFHAQGFQAGFNALALHVAPDGIRPAGETRTLALRTFGVQWTPDSR